MESVEEEILNKSARDVLINSLFLPWKRGAITDDKETSAVPSNLSLFGDPENQLFDFPPIIMRYIFLSSTSKIYENLIKTCKYFYSKYRILPIRHAMIDTHDIDMIYTPTFLPLSHLQKIWFTERLSISSSSNLLPKISEKIYKSTVCVLFINDQNITANDFDLLFEPEFLLYICLQKTVITKSDGDSLNCEEIVEKIPKAVDVKLRDILITPVTFFNISQMPRINKIQHFDLAVCEADQYLTFDVEQFKIFVKKFSAPKAYFNLHLYYKNDTRLEKDRNELQHLLETWVPFNDKPILHLF